MTASTITYSVPRKATSLTFVAALGRGIDQARMHGYVTLARRYGR